MMKSNSILLIIALTLFCSSAIAQSKWSVGFQGGRSQLIPFNGDTFKQLEEYEAAGMGGVNFQLYGKFWIKENFALYAGGGINNLVTGYRFNGLRRASGTNKGSEVQYFMGTEYNIKFGESGFGILGRFSFAIMGNNGSKRGKSSFESEEGIPWIGQVEVDPLSGGVDDGMVYLKKGEFSNSSSRFLMHLRPEIGFYKDFKKHRIMISAMYAQALERDFKVDQYLDLTYRGERRTAFHRFGGHYGAIFVGYEFRF
jgi:hypothetical protein